jgi:hypothetical protein
LRYGVNQMFIGGNFWHQTIGNYQATLWPCKTIFGYGNECEGEWATLGPRSLKDPVPIDIYCIRLTSLGLQRSESVA